jgi:arabinose operon protein AraL
MRCSPGEIKETFRHFEGFIIDIEGVLIKGQTVIAPAPPVIKSLNELNRKIVYLSNISDLTRAEVSEKLDRLGFDIEPDQIITSAYATALFLKEVYPDKKNVLLVGTDSFREELINGGINVVECSSDADTVVVGLDTELNYNKIGEAVKAVKNGSLLVASNLAKVKLTSDGYITGPGFVVKGLEYVTGKQAVLVGKPDKFMFGLALSKLELPPKKILTIGDKLEQDIHGGKQVGTYTCLVLSGASGRNDLSHEGEKNKPDYIIETIAEIIESC